MDYRFPHRLPMSWQITLSLPPGLITWTNDELPMNGIEGQETTIKGGSCNHTGCPAGTTSQRTNGSTDERVNGRTGQQRTNQRTNKRTSCNVEADESTPSYRRTPVVG